MLLTLYDPHRFYERVLDSLERWEPRPEQKAPALSALYRLRVGFKSLWRQGVSPGYRRAYWRYWGCLLRRWGLNPQKRRLGFELALSGHHFIRYARQVAENLEAQSYLDLPRNRPEAAALADGHAASLVWIDCVRK